MLSERDPMEGGVTSTEGPVETRADGVAQIRGRVATKIGTWLRDEQCVQLALACGTRMPGEMIEFLFSPQVGRSVENVGAENIAITGEEWEQLFGAQSQATRTGSMGEVMKEKSFEAAMGRVETALRRTVQEQHQSRVWQKPWHRTIVYVAVHMNEEEHFLEATLGNVVSADMRRLEELRSTIDEEGPETLLLASTIVALAETVT